MSIDGKWLENNEVREFREGPFVEDNISVLRQKVRDKFNEATSLFHNIKFFMSKDSFEELFPDDSFEMAMLDIYSTTYKNSCNFDSSDIKSIRNAISGFEYVIPGVQSIVDNMKNTFYPGINSKDFNIARNAKRIFRWEFSKFYMAHTDDLNVTRGINLEDRTFGRSSREINSKTLIKSKSL